MSEHPPLNLVDSHCHLDFPDFDGEQAELVARARAAGVTRMVTICTRLRSERNPAYRAASDGRSSGFGGGSSRGGGASGRW